MRWLLVASVIVFLAESSNHTENGRRSLEAVDFDVGLAELKKYKEQNGDLLVKQGAVASVDGNEIKLGRWVQRLRQLFKNTYTTPKARTGFGQMTDAQRKQLESIGFLFELPEELRPPEAVEWDEAFEELVKWHKQHKNCVVPQSTVVKTEDGNEIKLGKW